MLTHSQLMHSIFSVSDLVCKVSVDHVEDGVGGPTFQLGLMNSLQPCPFLITNSYNRVFAMTSSITYFI